MRKIALRTLFLLLCFFYSSFPCLASDVPEMPFKEGEKITFLLKWWVFPAGQATLEVMPLTEINGQPARHFVMTARTNKFADSFYKVRDRVEGFTDLTMTKSLFYKKKQREGSTKHDVVVEFDWDKSQAIFTEDGNTAPPIDIPPGSFDPLSILYRARMFDFKKGAEFEIPVTDGKKAVIGQGKIRKKKKIHVPGGKFEVFEFIPDLKHIGGVFKESKDAKMKLWFGADEKKRLIKMKSKVTVGSFSAEMEKVEEN